jgi:hypothetical protein
MREAKLNHVMPVWGTEYFRGEQPQGLPATSEGSEKGQVGGDESF